MWLVGLPIAALPLWQLAQFATIPAWFIRAPANVAVLLWQFSQGAFVTMWFCGLPIAAMPLWQAAQPVLMPAWLGFVLAAGPVGEA